MSAATKIRSIQARTAVLAIDPAILNFFLFMLPSFEMSGKEVFAFGLLAFWRSGANIVPSIYSLFRKNICLLHLQ
jgi:hypothetical protein